MKLLHILRQPVNVPGGTSIRTLNEINTQRRICDLYAITSPYFYDSKYIADKNPEIIKDVKHYHSLNEFNYFYLGYLKKFPLIRNLIKKYHRYRFLKFSLNLSSKIKFNLIQAHSPFSIGYVGLNLANKTGKPFVYEVRGFVEDARVAKGEIKENSFRYNKIRKKENYIMKC